MESLSLFVKCDKLFACMTKECVPISVDLWWGIADFWRQGFFGHLLPFPFLRCLLKLMKDARNENDTPAGWDAGEVCPKQYGRDFCGRRS